MRAILVIFIALFLSSSVGAQIKLYRTYKPGCYYDNSGKKISGLMDFEPYKDRIHFKKDEKSSSEKISIKDISAVVITYEDANKIQVSDSLVVMTEDNKEDKKYFAAFYSATSTTKFYYKFLEPTTSGAVKYTTLSNVPNTTNNGVHNITLISTPPITSYSEKMMMYQEGNTTYQLTKGNYIDVLSKACADQVDLVKRIQKKEFKFRDVYEILAIYSKPSAKSKKTDDGNLDSLLHH